MYNYPTARRPEILIHRLMTVGQVQKQLDSREGHHGAGAGATLQGHRCQPGDLPMKVGRMDGLE